MSINIKFNNIVKRYKDLTVIPGLSFSINKAEFFTLLGPSGCGKTTLLRMVAGFNSIEEGEIYFDDVIVNRMPPSKRNIGMVFQNYAIFPHLSVNKNISFGLENRKVPKDQIKTKVDEILNVVQMNQYKNRMPSTLSGGQQQRIALARATVINPALLLMDEPLSNLDAKLRVELRSSIKNIQKKLGITTIYVTHDQAEAMAVSDRIGVMKDGLIHHIGTPQNIYHRPASLFVSTFIGHSNIMESKIRVNHGKYELVLSEDYKVEMDNIDTHLVKKDEDVKVSIRPEEFIIDHKAKVGLNGMVKSNVFLGVTINYIIELDNGQCVEVLQESSLKSQIMEGERVKLVIKKEKINVFRKDGFVNYTLGVINDIDINQYNLEGDN